MIKRKKNMVVYQAKSGAIELRGDFSKETLWATQEQIALVFGVDRSVATKHVNNILKSGEVRVKSNVQKVHIAKSDKPVSLYSLDIILAVGYRTNSARAIEFRQWATKVLRDHITKGYTLNRKQLAKNYSEFMSAVEQIQKTLPTHVSLDPVQVLELVKEFASTWVSLDAYDREELTPIGTTRKGVSLAAEELQEVISEFRDSQLRTGDATEHFAQERERGSVAGIVGNVMQSFGGTPMYPTVEEKAAHLLYFMVKNHPFVDGNKRTGAFTFAWFLRKARARGKVTPAALTALTLLIAESEPAKKDQVVALVTRLIWNT